MTYQSTLFDDVPVESFKPMTDKELDAAITTAATADNLTRQDGIDFLGVAPKIGIVTQTTTHTLTEASQAPADLRAGRFDGAAVLAP